MAFSLGTKSIAKLNGVHPDLVKVVKHAIEITDIDFTVLEGRRTMKRQKELVAAGKSQTMKSRHLTGHAVDLGAWIGGTVSWDGKYYQKIANAMERAAEEVGVKIEWGGNWKTFHDGPHFQLPWEDYP